MATTTASGGPERVLVLLDSHSSEAALDAAAELARRRRAQLVALFVEDSDLLSTSELPFAREIGLVSGVSRPLSAPAVAQRMAARVARLRALLRRVARQWGIEAVLEVGRGHQAQAVLARVRPQDLLIVRRGEWAQRPGGVLERLLAHAGCAVMLVGGGQGPARAAPMVLVDGTEGAGRALSCAIALLGNEARALTLVLAPGHGGSESRARARSLTSDHGVEARLIEIERLDLLEVLRTIRRERPPMLFVSRECPLFTIAAGRRPAELDELPLVIVP